MDISRERGIGCDSGEPDKYLDELSNLIESWMKNLPPEKLSELLQPNKDRLESLKRMARPYEAGGLEIPFPEEYPFGVHFLTVNLLAMMYGLRPEIMHEILSRISEVYGRAKKRLPTGKEAEILAGQVEKCEEVIRYMASTTAKEVKNLEWFINKSLANWFKGGKWLTKKSKKELREADLTSEEDMERGKTLSGQACTIAICKIAGWFGSKGSAIRGYVILCSNDGQTILFDDRRATLGSGLAWCN